MVKGEIRKKASPVNEEIVRVKGNIVFSHLVSEDPEYGGYQVVLNNFSPEAVLKMEADGLVLKDVLGMPHAETGERIIYPDCYKFRAKRSVRLQKEGVEVNREEVKFNPGRGSEVVVAYSLWDTNYKGKAHRTAFMIGVDVTKWIDYVGEEEGNKPYRASAPIL